MDYVVFSKGKSLLSLLWDARWALPGGYVLESNPFVQVINLARRPDRLARITDDLSRAGINFEVQVAVDGHLVSLASPSLSKGEIGCWKSHINAMRTIFEVGASYALILEDDAVLGSVVSPGFLSSMTQLMKRNDIDLLQLGFIEQYYDVFIRAGLLKYVIAKLRNRGTKDISGFRFVVGDFRAGTHAYIVNNRLARVLLEEGKELPMRPWDGYLNAVASGQVGLDAKVARLGMSVISQASRQRDSQNVDSDIAPA